jgi:RNase P protein component
MDNFDNEKWEKQPAAAPEGMFEQVRQRIIQERIQMAQNRRQLVFGSALLLVIGAFNIGLVLSKTTEKQAISRENTEKTLRETYFDTTLILSNEK